MPSIVLPDLDKSTVEDLKKRIPNLTEIDLPNLQKLDLSSLRKLDLPKLENVGKNADQSIDRLLGRSRAPVWPWVAVGVALVAAIGAAAAYFTWWRRPAWESTSEPWTATAPESTSETFTDEQSGSTLDGTGLTAAESSLTSNPYSTEEV